MPQYSFSLNGENWSGAFATREEALATAIQKCSGAADPPGTVFVGEMPGGEMFADHLGRVVVKELCARRQGTETSDRNLREVTAHQLAELDALLEKAVSGWLKDHRLTAEDFKVEAISEHLTPVPHRGLRSANSNGKKEVQDLGVSDFPG